MNRTRKSHARKVFECFTELRDDDGSRLMTIMRKYGKKTRDEAIQRLKEYKAEQCGMTIEEFEKFLEEDN